MRKFWMSIFAAPLLCSSLFAQHILPECDDTCKPDPTSVGYSNIVKARPAVVNARGTRSRIQGLVKGPAKTTIETGNESFGYSVPIVHLPGRNGFDLDLTLYYNSDVWSFDQGDSYLTFNADRDWPSYGFRLDFGYIEETFDSNGAREYVLTEPDGAKHLLQQALNSGGLPTGSYAATDSSYFSLDPVSMVLTAKNGNQTSYQVFPSAASTGTLYRPTKVQDTNGNFINIQYVAGKDQALQTVTDTLGRVINFTYDSNGLLTSLSQVIAGGATKIHATFSWRQIYAPGQSWSNFTLGAGGAPPSSSAVTVLASCIYSERHWL